MNCVSFFLINLLGAAFFLGASFYLYSSWQDRVRLGSSSLSWSTVPATFEGGYADYVGSVSTPGTTPYQPRISYSYTVSGTGYYNDVIGAASRSFRRREQAEAFVDAYPKTTLQAYYNPENPSESVLEPGIPLSWRVLIVLPLVCLGVAAMCLFVGIKALLKGVPVLTESL